VIALGAAGHVMAVELAEGSSYSDLSKPILVSHMSTAGKAIAEQHTHSALAM
jgi:hypothetical protein